MFEANDILTLLGIPGNKIKSYTIDTVNDVSVVYIELHDIRRPCPKCGSTDISIKDYYRVKINNSIIKHRQLLVELRVRRYKCLKCGKTFKQEYDFYENRDRISIALKGQILEDLKERNTFIQIARDHNVSPKTIRNIFDTFVLPQPQLPLTEIICVDEFCYKHKGKEDKYPFVITDPISTLILDIVKSRRKDVLIEYFNKVKVSQRYNVRYFVSDMNETYRIIKRIFFKNAIHIADRFHIVKAFNEAITSIRMRIIKQEVYQENEYNYLKKNWKIFLKDRHELSKKKYVDKWGIVTDPTVALDRCLAKYPDLYYAYWTKEEFRHDTSRLLYYKKAEEVINFYINKLSNSTIEEIRVVGKMLENWKFEAINGITQNPYSIKISNAIAESTNNQIQTLIDLCYGLPEFNAMRKRVLYINRNRNQKD